MLTKDEILDVITSSVLQANDEYSEMSGGWNLQDSGIESYVSASIAKELCNQGRAKDGQAFCILEAGPRLIFDSSGADNTKGPIPKTYRQSGRVDIAYFNGKHQPIGLVEVKRHFGWSGMENDIRRLRWILKRCGPEKHGSVRWGAVVGFDVQWENSRKTLQQRLDLFTDEFSTQFRDLKSYTCIAPKSRRAEEQNVSVSASGFSSAAILFKMNA